MRFRASLAILFLALGSAAARADTTVPGPVETLYRASINAMDGLRQPPYITYTMRGDPQGFAVDLIDRDHLIWLNIHSGSTPSAWQIRHRTDDYASEVLQEYGPRYVSQRSFFDPTWYGAYHALRDGMLNYQVPEKPVSARATPQPDASAPTLHVIAAVNVMGPTIYQLEDRGNQPCPSGSAGHAIHLIPRDRDPKHQLNDVIVDLGTQRLCMIRFGVRDAFGFHGVVEQHYGNVGGYWMQTDGFLDGTMRMFGIAMRHGKWIYRLDEMAFPRALPVDIFVTPFEQ